MTLDRPLWLLLLVALPLLWWLHRRLRAPQEIVVASVDALRGARVEAAGARPRRVLDMELALLLAAAAGLGLAAAGPRLGASQRTVLVALDTSASMAAPGVDGRSLLESAWEEALAAARDAGAEAVEVVDLAAPTRSERVGTEPADAPFVPTGVSDDLPEALAPLLARARQEGFGGLLLVTDRAVDAGADVVVSGPRTVPAPQPVVIDAVLGDGDALVSVRPAPREESVLRATFDGAVPRTERRVPAGSDVVVVSVPAPPSGGTATYSIGRAGAGGAATLRARREGGARVVRLSGPGARAPRVRSLLATLSIDAVADSLTAVDAEIIVGGPPAPPPGDAPPRLHLAVAPGTDARIDVRAAQPLVPATRVACTGALAEAPPSPGVTLARTGVLDVIDGEPEGVWRAPDGLLAAMLPRRVVTTLDPDATGSTWHRDGSFPVFVLGALETLAGGPDRLTPLDGPAVSERLREGAPPAPATAQSVARLVRPADADPRGRALGGPLAGGAALLVLVAVASGAGRFSGPGRR